MIDLAASHAHYLAHLLPVWRALPATERGTAYLAAPLRSHLHDSAPIAAIGQAENPVLVAGFEDLRNINGHAILMEHGCGQSYAGDPDEHAACVNPAYAGGDGRHGVLAFLCPNEYAAARNRAKNPDAVTVVVGSPRLGELQRVPHAPDGERPVVAVGFHAQFTFCPEAGTGYPHWRDAVAALAASGEFEVLGHGHPRSWSDLRPAYQDMGIEPVASFNEVLARAHVYCCDNSSTLFEWAAVRGPTVVLDWPAARPWVNHGLRWWDAADVGPRIIEPVALPVAVRSALARSPWPGAEERLARVFPAIENPARVAAAAAVAACDRVSEVRPRSGSRFPRSTRAPA